MAPIPVRVKRAALQDRVYQALLERDEDTLARKKMMKVGDLLYRNHGEEGGQLVVPQNQALRTWILSWAHDSTEGAHRGGARMYEWLRTRVYWTNLATDAQRYANGCEACQRNKPDLRGRQGLPMSIETPQRAGEVLCMDFVGPFARSADGLYTHVLVVVDKLTRYVMYIPLGDNATAQVVFGALDQRWLAIFGPPKAIISDRDARFTSHYWADL